MCCSRKKRKKMIIKVKYCVVHGKQGVGMFCMYYWNVLPICVALCEALCRDSRRRIGFFSQSSKAQYTVKLLKQSYFSDILVQPDPGCVIQIKFSDCGMSEALENALRLAEGFRRHWYKCSLYKVVLVRLSCVKSS